MNINEFKREITNIDSLIVLAINPGRVNFIWDLLQFLKINKKDYVFIQEWKYTNDDVIIISSDLFFTKNYLNSFSIKIKKILEVSFNQVFEALQFQIELNKTNKNFLVFNYGIDESITNTDSHIRSISSPLMRYSRKILITRPLEIIYAGEISNYNEHNWEIIKSNYLKFNVKNEDLVNFNEIAERYDPSFPRFLNLYCSSRLFDNKAGEYENHKYFALLRAYFLDLYRLRFVTSYKKIFGEKFVVVGSQFKKFIPDALSDNNSIEFFKNKINLDLQSHSFYNPFYERKLAFFIKESPTLTYGLHDHSVVRLKNSKNNFINLNFSNPVELAVILENLQNNDEYTLDIECI